MIKKRKVSIFLSLLMVINYASAQDGWKNHIADNKLGNWKQLYQRHLQ